MYQEYFLSKKRLISNLLTLILISYGGYYLFSKAYFADINTSQKRDNQIVGAPDNTHSYKQSFTPSSPYIAMIELHLLSSGYPNKNPFQIIIHLQDRIGNDISITTYDIPKSAQEFNIKFTFKPQQDSLNNVYYLLIQSNAPPNTILLLGSEYDAYTRGELFANTKPINEDLAFFVYSKPPPLVLAAQTIQKSAFRFADIFFITAVFFLLGYSLSSIFIKSGSLIEKTIYAFVIGISFPPLLFFLMSFLYIKLEKQYLITIFLGWLLIALALALKSLHNKTSRIQFPSVQQTKEILILSLLFIIALFTRVSQINDIQVPSGVGAQTHQKIIEKIAERAEIPLGSIYYLGFHSNVYLVHLLTNHSIPESTLVFGQWLSVISGLSFYALARKTFSNPTIAIVTTSLYWFASPIPAYLINISRYPFLQGMVLLPSAIVLISENIKSQLTNKFAVTSVSIYLQTALARLERFKS